MAQKTAPDYGREAQVSLDGMHEAIVENDDIGDGYDDRVEEIMAETRDITSEIEELVDDD